MEPLERLGDRWRVPQNSRERQIVLFTWRTGCTFLEAVMPGKSGSPLGVLGLTTREFKS